MLPRSRILSVLLLGLGVTLLMVGVAYPRVSVLGQVVPLDAVDYVLVDDSAQLRLVGGEVEPAPVERAFHVEYTDPKNNETATVRVGASVGRTDRESDLAGLLTAEVYSYVLNRTTAEVEASAAPTVAEQLATPPRSVDMVGSLWWAFPPAATGEVYPVWDPVLRSPIEAHRTSAETFVQEIPATNVAEKYSNAFTEPAPGRVLWYEGTRTFTVDEATGVIVNVAEKLHTWEASAEGEDPVDVLVFDGRLSEVSQARAQELAAQQTDPRVVTGVSAAVAGVGGLLGLLGAIGVVGVFDRRGRKR
ncbi:MAG: porin PorA family protein [Corynebacterium sp.]|nr:porin PorA family protein [Corynebacterium sp.]